MAKKSFMNNFKLPLTRDELKRAFYVDFEGRGVEGDESLLLGVLWKRYKNKSLSLRHYILDERLNGLADECFMANADLEEHEWVAQNLKSTITQLLQLAETQDRLFISWSQHDYKIASEVLETSIQQQQLKERWRDGKATAIQWTKRHGHEMPRGQNKLSAFIRLLNDLGCIETEVPEKYGEGRTGENLRVMLDASERYSEFDSFTARQQDRWCEVVGHNFYDLEGMREVVSYTSTITHYQFGFDTNQSG